MSKHKSNVNPDHYKTAGREAQGRDLDHDAERQAYAQSVVKEKRQDPRDAVEDLERPPRQTQKIQTSGKVGKRSSSQKMAAARHNAGPIPAARPAPGAFGRSGRKQQPQTKAERMRKA